ncbi:AGE family epimerase/isomerase [Prevotella sp. S7 MS 2]|uniref:AGE family epimerase/isomerase n=1 Tax=Prevotella sp. S7 MS 2 TaxID=1287488 RepID=UPI000513341A|nr:AGE family epimerase/isomerase [Prevotella sp. S7 MS 2]KGI60701.1 N-acyl-D-glucosamine 2-epimerase [Prevotella sp. S7 MS 2]
MNGFKQIMQEVLEHNILQYWLDKAVDQERGGFYGRIDGHDVLHADADKGAVLHARILWAFSAAYRVLQKPEYLKAAMHAKDYLLEHFVDKEYGGVYWCVDCNGEPVDTKKQTYAIGFAIYGLSEYARATGDRQALDMAILLYHDIENHAFDSKNNGYIEALTREWEPIADMRLSDKDENGSRTMNTHLHIIEPYTNLYRVWKDAGLEQRIRNLLTIFTGRILNHKTWHLDLFFNDEWESERNIQSFGHDIEASWLLHESALVLGDKALLRTIGPLVRRIADAADEGLQADGSMLYERWLDSGREDRQRQWWVQCENIVGHVNLYQHFGDEEALGVAVRCWAYVQKNLIDWKIGEWHWAMLDDGTLNLEDDKIGLWKCPYHNSRMCLELMERM